MVSRPRFFAEMGIAKGGRVGREGPHFQSFLEMATGCSSTVRLRTRPPPRSWRILVIEADRPEPEQRAEEYIDELPEELKRALRRLRQSGIDEELFDVISGFEALTGPRQPSARSGR